jgi:MFS family permease
MVSEQLCCSPKALCNAVCRFVVLVAGLANASDSIEILMVSDVLTAFGPPDNCSICMNDTEKALLAAAMFVGMLFGGVICGSLGDRFGRRRLLMSTTLLNALCGLLFSFASAPWVLSLLRFGTGFGVGGGIPILFAMGSEAVPPLRRGLCLCVIASFFMVGQLVLTSFSLLIDHYGWRVFSVVCASFPLITCILAFFTPESPRYHSLHGDNASAYDVLRRFASSQQRRDPQTLERLSTVCPSADSLLRMTKKAPSVQQAASMFFSRELLLLNATLVIVWISMNFGWSVPRRRCCHVE